MEPILREMEAEIPRLRRYARFLARNQDKADDLVQDCLTKAIHKLATWRPGTNLRAWLFTILRNGHIDDARRHRRVPLVEMDSELPELAISAGCEERIQLRELWRALICLPVEQKKVIQLVVIEGLTYREAADILGIAVGTVRSRLSRARSVLRLRLDGGGRVHPAHGWSTQVIRQPDRSAGARARTPACSPTAVAKSARAA